MGLHSGTNFGPAETAFGRVANASQRIQWMEFQTLAHRPDLNAHLQGLYDKCASDSV